VERALAGGIPALFSFFDVVQHTEGLEDILLNVVRKPSLWSVITHIGVSVNLRVDVKNMLPADPTPWGSLSGSPMYYFPLMLDLNRELALKVTFVVTSPRPPLLACGVGRAKANQVHAVVAPHECAHASGGGRVVSGRKELDVARVEHHTAVGRADRALRRALHGSRRHAQAERLADTRRGVEIGDEVRDVIEVELARRRPLPVGGVHGALI